MQTVAPRPRRDWAAPCLHRRSDQPRTCLKDEPLVKHAVHYGFDLWGQKVADFCRQVIELYSTNFLTSEHSYLISR